MSELSIWIRAERKKRRLSQAKFSRLLGLRQYVLSAWELDKAIPDKTDVQTIQEVLETFDDDLTTGKAQSFLRRNSPKTVTFSLAELNSKNGNGHKGNGQRPPSDYRNMLSNSESIPAPNLNAISLFSGCGGFSLGFRWAGFRVVGHVEVERSARIIYEANFPESKCLGHDIRQVTDAEIGKWQEKFGHIHVLFGGPPCQGFSLAGKRDDDDPRNRLYREFTRVAHILRPDIALMENVRLITSMKAPDHSLVTKHILRDFDAAGYRCKFRPINAQDYGIPQSRERVFFIGIRNDFSDAPIVFPERTHGAGDELPLFGLALRNYTTFRDATQDLESLESGESSAVDKWHFAVKHPDHVIHMLRDVPEGESAHENPDLKLRPTSGYNTTYKRLRWDEPCSTVSTNFGMISGSRNVHPTNTRSLTVREALRCQSFPDDFRLHGTLGEIRTAIGNAVPPLLAKVLADHLKSAYLLESLSQLGVCDSIQPAS
jgi:DNA (cytosine-5)-methyltransferase 1